MSSQLINKSLEHDYPTLGLVPPKRLLLGPGPSEVDPIVLASLSLPPLGHLDPALLTIMDEIRDMLRAAFVT
ncbi:MAG TPA: alanine--glyoxylate aminotransferase family protein, partial [Chloroflexia bacterium]|nr:alanine--glyoxylate aminotransferase family protein [Chloroflexia bacterium]